jgi:hypothetical protein
MRKWTNGQMNVQTYVHFSSHFDKLSRTHMSVSVQFTNEGQLYHIEQRNKQIYKGTEELTDR